MGLILQAQVNKTFMNSFKYENPQLHPFIAGLRHIQAQPPKTHSFSSKHNIVI